MARNLRNCRACHATYEKPENYWCEIPLRNNDGTIVEPVGFCEFCDKNNEAWYMPDAPCKANCKEKGYGLCIMCRREQIKELE